MRFRSAVAALVLALPLGVPSLADAAGMIVKTSTLRPDEAAKRIEAAIAEAGGTIVAGIDHSRDDEMTRTELLPNRSIAFIRHELTTQLLGKDPSFAAELPLRIAVFADGEGSKIAYRDPATLNTDFDFGDLPGTVANVASMLDVVTQKGVAP